MYKNVKWDPLSPCPLSGDLKRTGFVQHQQRLTRYRSLCHMTHSGPSEARSGSWGRLEGSQPSTSRYFKVFRMGILPILHIRSISMCRIRSTSWSADKANQLYEGNAEERKKRKKKRGWVGSLNVYIISALHNNRSV